MRFKDKRNQAHSNNGSHDHDYDPKLSRKENRKLRKKNEKHMHMA